MENFNNFYKFKGGLAVTNMLYEPLVSNNKKIFCMNWNANKYFENAEMTDELYNYWFNQEVKYLFKLKNKKYIPEVINIDYSKSEEDAKNKAEIMKGKGQSINTYPVYFFETDTSGEKLFEEFYEKKANINLNRYKSLGVIVSESISKQVVNNNISLIETLFKNKNFNQV